MKLLNIIEKAKEAAKVTGTQMIIYENLRCRWWNRVPECGSCSVEEFDKRIVEGELLIQLSLILPNGYVHL